MRTGDATSISTFSDPSAGIKFIDPSDWKKEGPTYETTDYDFYDVNFLDPDPESYMYKGLSDIGVTVSKMRDPMTLEEYVKEQFSWRPQLVPDGSLGYLDGRPAFKTEEQWDDGVVVKYLLMVNDGYTYFLEGRTTNDISTIDAIINSFQIINDGW